jgi:hypothetical protein
MRLLLALMDLGDADESAYVFAVFLNGGGQLGDAFLAGFLHGGDEFDGLSEGFVAMNTRAWASPRVGRIRATASSGFQWFSSATADNEYYVTFFAPLTEVMVLSPRLRGPQCAEYSPQFNQ